jgi:hypothetical protein
MPSEGHFFRVGGIAAILGVIIFLLATLAHPMQTDPADAIAAFAEYAADRFWVASHLAQLLGVALITGGLLALSWRLRAGRAGVWAVLGGIGAIASVTTSGVLQAVDGIALKVMVDRWVSASPEEQALLFESAFAVRQIEIGLAGIVLLVFGLTAILYGCALWMSDEASNWLGGFGVATGVLLLGAGVMYAYTGFSATAMMASMPGSLLLTFWGIGVGVYLLRSSSRNEKIA